MSRRWLVERPTVSDSFEDVGADAVLIDRGSLLFFDEHGELSIAYATGQWLTVCQNEAGGYHGCDCGLACSVDEWAHHLAGVLLSALGGAA